MNNLYLVSICLIFFINFIFLICQYLNKTNIQARKDLIKYIKKFEINPNNIKRRKREFFNLIISFVLLLVISILVM